MKKGVTWAKWNVVDFLDGTLAMEPQIGWPYTVVLMLIYRDGGATRNDPVAIGQRCGMRPSSASKSIRKLVELGKLIVLNDGRLTNERASTEIAKVVQKSTKSTIAAQLRWGKTREIGQRLQQNGNADALQTHSERNADGMPYKSIDNKLTTSVPSSARASSSGLEGPPTRSESPEQNNSQGGIPEKLRHLPAERQEVVLQAYRRMARDPATGKKLRA